MQNDEVEKRKKWLIGGAVTILVLILVISLGFLVYDRIFSARVNIMVAPSIAKVKIDDMEFSSTANMVKMQPGEYRVEVSAEGFDTKTGKLILKADETGDVRLYLESNDESTKDWYDTHAGDALVVGEIQNEETLKALNALIEKEPVIANLPLTVEYYANNYSTYTKYVISYALNDSDRGFYLIVKDYTGAGMASALDKLAEMGMDTIGLELKYENLEDESLSPRAE